MPFFRSLRSLRTRLVLSYVLLTLLTVGVLVMLALTLIRATVSRQEVDALRVNAEAIAQQAAPFMSPVPQRRELDRLARASAFLGNVRVRVLDEKGRSIVDSQRPSAQQEITIDGTKFRLVRRVDSVYGVRFVFEMVTDSASPEVSEVAPAVETGITQIAFAPIQNAAGYIEVTATRPPSNPNLANTTQALALAGLVAIGVAVVLGLLVSRGLLAPLRQLAAAANQMGRGDLTVRTRIGERGDEIGQVANQFDQMAVRLQLTFADLQTERDALRRFIADASHELRTPITALRMYNELMQGRAVHQSLDEKTRAEFLSESQKQLSRLAWITQNLLDLSRLDAGLSKLSLAEADLGEMVTSVAAGFKPAAMEKGVTLQVRKPQQPVLAQVDCARMEMALSNLIENAVKFTPSGGAVEVSVRRTEQAIELSVSDTGVGIPEADVPHVFDRFYRGQNANAMQGDGLGLAIVQSIAQAHGGAFRVVSEVGQGSTFMIELTK
jgi:signal transduction histidine kinase